MILVLLHNKKTKIRKIETVKYKIIMKKIVLTLLLLISTITINLLYCQNVNYVGKKINIIKKQIEVVDSLKLNKVVNVGKSQLYFFNKKDKTKNIVILSENNIVITYDESLYNEKGKYIKTIKQESIK
jgi:hypothetical protein